MASPFQAGWPVYIFYLHVCVYKYVLVLGKLMQLWEFFSCWGIFYIFLLAEFETIWNAAMLACAL